MYGGADDNVTEPVVDKSGDVVILLTSALLSHFCSFGYESLFS